MNRFRITYNFRLTFEISHKPKHRSTFVNSENSCERFNFAGQQPVDKCLIQRNKLEGNLDLISKTKIIVFKKRIFPFFYLVFNDFYCLFVIFFKRSTRSITPSLDRRSQTACINCIFFYLFYSKFFTIRNSSGCRRSLINLHLSLWS